MAVSTTAIFDLIEALLAKLGGDATLASYNVLVNDGPILTDASRPNIIYVGAQPSDQTGASPDGSFEQAWGELGARARNEVLTVACELRVRDGSTDLVQRRADAKAILAAVESALRIDFSLSVGRLRWCEVKSGQLIQQQTQTGSSVSVPFTIAASARLASQ